ncbi:MAG TPA: DUF1993 domain-containing protein [Caulobacteraceae bacterium]|nr:DUF1993 domain-containing protein [Caulobacteraceae bacterium]
MAKVDLYTFTDLYRRVLDSLSHLLGKGAEFAKANGISEAEMLQWRLIDDMSPLAFQVRIVVNFTRAWPARVLGAPLPEDIAQDLSVAQLQHEIAASKAYLADLTAGQFEDRDDVPLQVTLGTGMAPTLPAGQWLSVFATTNIYFHLSIAYAILRSRGVQIGKSDLFAGQL